MAKNHKSATVASMSAAGIHAGSRGGTGGRQSATGHPIRCPIVEEESCSPRMSSNLRSRQSRWKSLPPRPPSWEQRASRILAPRSAPNRAATRAAIHCSKREEAANRRPMPRRFHAARSTTNRIAMCPIVRLAEPVFHRAHAQHRGLRRNCDSGACDGNGRGGSRPGCRAYSLLRRSFIEPPRRLDRQSARIQLQKTRPLVRMANLKCRLAIAQRIADQSAPRTPRSVTSSLGRAGAPHRGTQIANHPLEFGGIHRQIAHTVARPLLDLIFRNIDTAKSHSGRRAIGRGMIRRRLFGRHWTEHGGQQSQQSHGNA